MLPFSIFVPDFQKVFASFLKFFIISKNVLTFKLCSLGDTNIFRKLKKKFGIIKMFLFSKFVHKFRKMFVFQKIFRNFKKCSHFQVETQFQDNVDVSKNLRSFYILIAISKDVPVFFVLISKIHMNTNIVRIFKKYSCFISFGLNLKNMFFNFCLKI